MRHALRAGAALAAALAAVPLPAQTRAGVIRGVVADAAGGGPIAGATVLLRGTQLAATTGAEGRFRLSGVAPGRYALRVIAIGYRPALRAGAEVRGGDTLELRVAMRRASLALQPVVVTASRAPERAGEATASVAALGREEIVRREPVTIDEALPFVPGVDFNNGSMDVRGAEGLAGGVGSRVLMLLDGHPVLSGDGGEIDFNAVSMLDLERAELVKGAYSALYGSAALGGVLNLITSDIPDRPRSDLRLYYGAYDVPGAIRSGARFPSYRGLDVQHSRRVGDVGARVAATVQSSDGFEQNGGLRRWLWRAKLASGPAGAHPWDAYAIWSREDAGEHFAWRSADQPYAVAPEAVGDWSRDDKLLAGATIAALARARAVLRIEPYFTHDAVRNHFHDNGDFHRAARVGSSARLSVSVGDRHTVVAGTELSRTAVASNFLGRPTLRDAAVFLQDEARLGERLRLSAGLRADGHDASGAQAETAVNPKLGLAYTPSDHLSVRASIGRGYRAPSAIEQFVSTTQSGFRVVPNPALHGETAWSSELGAATVLGALGVDGAIFRSEYRDLIGPAAAPGQAFVFQFRNVSRALVRGLDLGTKLTLARDRLHCGVNYLFLDSRDLATGLPLPYRSRHTVTGSIDALAGRIGIDVRRRSRVEQVLAYPLDPRSAITLVDLRLGQRIFGADVALRVSNLLQERYVDVRERNQGAPRDVRLTARSSF